MKKLVVAIVILVVIVVAGILESVYIDKIFTELDSRLYEVEPYIHAEDPVALIKVRDMKNWWESKRRAMEMFTYSPDIRAFSVALAETEGSLEIEDYKNGLSKWQSLITMSDNIHRILDFNAEDII